VCPFAATSVSAFFEVLSDRTTAVWSCTLSVRQHSQHSPEKTLEARRPIRLRDTSVLDSVSQNLSVVFLPAQIWFPCRGILLHHSSNLCLADTSHTCGHLRGCTCLLQKSLLTPALPDSPGHSKCFSKSGPVRLWPGSSSQRT
jgi:hypothetical protein